MLNRYCSQFLAYCQLADFSARSIQALTIRLNELANFLNILKIRSGKRVSCRHLIDFAAAYKDPSIHVTKSRVWTLRQFFHFLTLHRHIQKNIALKPPYPEISKTVPQLLTTDQYNRLICHFSEWADSSIELRNLILIMLYITTIKVLVIQ
ncbi:MAG: hypothetical protein SRB1_01183 [Desulfobacteraceae bacterium Eth-SRB1]|nr:MAG: hypothetical protein SRB1_01183 [Desulfobacteraceae bacterium Eth-SRB1]